jgi:glycerol dehydrogenase-like iron-containing ADH family enzyme
MKWSARLFKEDVWPLIQNDVGGGILMQMEGRTDSALASALDMHAGIDAWQIHPRLALSILSQ